MHCLRRILVISWRDKVTNSALLERAGISTMFSLLRQRRMRWLDHIGRMEDRRIPKDLLYSELVTGKRLTGRPQLRYYDTCKCILKALGINTDTREAAASDRSTWKQEVHKDLSFQRNPMQKAEEKRSCRKTWLHADRPVTTFTCGKCHRDCHSHIGLLSHTRRC